MNQISPTKSNKPVVIRDGNSIVQTQEIEEYVCQRLTEGSSLITIGNELEFSPSLIYKWLDKPESSSFRERYARAREAQADYFLDKQIEFSETATLENYQLRKFQADNLKWVAAKLKPKKYGDLKHIDIEQRIQHTAKLASNELTNDQLIEALRKADADGMLPPDVKLLNNGDVVVAEYEEIEPVKEDNNGEG